VVFVSATGMLKGRFTEATYARTIYHRQFDGQDWSGIQITTAAGVCGVVDMMREGKLPQSGLVRMEQVSYPDFLANRFGQYYA
jgi:saccharopine dehydrogenase-like NADP-dependent oxidoreductase